MVIDSDEDDNDMDTNLFDIDELRGNTRSSRSGGTGTTNTGTGTRGRPRLNRSNDLIAIEPIETTDIAPESFGMIEEEDEEEEEDYSYKISRDVFADIRPLPGVEGDTIGLRSPLALPSTTASTNVRPPGLLDTATENTASSSSATELVTVSSSSSSTPLVAPWTLIVGDPDRSIILADGTRIPAKRCAFCGRGEEPRIHIPSVSALDFDWTNFDPLAGVEGKMIPYPVYIPTGNGVISAVTGPKARMKWVHINCARYAPLSYCTDEHEDWPAIVRDPQHRIIRGGIDEAYSNALVAAKTAAGRLTASAAAALAGLVSSTLPNRLAPDIGNLRLLLYQPTLPASLFPTQAQRLRITLPPLTEDERTLTLTEVQQAIREGVSMVPAICTIAPTDTEYLSYGIGGEVKRSSSAKCTICGRTGASIGCSHQSCTRTFHFRCAIANGWSGWRGGIDSGIPYGSDFSALSLCARAIETRAKALAAIANEAANASATGRRSGSNNALVAAAKSANAAVTVATYVPDEFQPMYCDKHRSQTAGGHRNNLSVAPVASPPRATGTVHRRLGIGNSSSTAAQRTTGLLNNLSSSSSSSSSAQFFPGAGPDGRTLSRSELLAIARGRNTNNADEEDNSEGEDDFFDDSDDDWNGNSRTRRLRRTHQRDKQSLPDTRDSRAQRRADSRQETTVTVHGSRTSAHTKDPDEEKRKARRRKQEFLWRQSTRLERSWILRTHAIPLLYIPQVGDQVVYIPHGHEAYLQDSGMKKYAQDSSDDEDMDDNDEDEEYFLDDQHNLRRSASGSTRDFEIPYEKWPSTWTVILATIENIRYSFPKRNDIRYRVPDDQITYGSVMLHDDENDEMEDNDGKKKKSSSSSSSKKARSDTNNSSGTTKRGKSKTVAPSKGKGKSKGKAKNDDKDDDDEDTKEVDNAPIPGLPTPDELDDQEAYFIVADLTLRFEFVQTGTDGKGNVVWGNPRASRTTVPPSTFNLRYHPGLTANGPEFLLLRQRYEASMKRVAVALGLAHLSPSNASLISGTSSTGTSSNNESISTVVPYSKRLCRIAFRQAKYGWEEGLTYMDTPDVLLPPALVEPLDKLRKQQESVIVRTGTNVSTGSKKLKLVSRDSKITSTISTGINSLSKPGLSILLPASVFIRYRTMIQRIMEFYGVHNALQLAEKFNPRSCSTSSLASLGRSKGNPTETLDTNNNDSSSDYQYTGPDYLTAIEADTGRILRVRFLYSTETSSSTTTAISTIETGSSSSNGNTSGTNTNKRSHRAIIDDDEDNDENDKEKDQDTTNMANDNDEEEDTGNGVSLGRLQKQKYFERKLHDSSSSSSSSTTADPNHSSSSSSGTNTSILPSTNLSSDSHESSSAIPTNISDPWLNDYGYGVWDTLTYTHPGTSQPSYSSKNNYKVSVALSLGYIPSMVPSSSTSSAVTDSSSAIPSLSTNLAQYVSPPYASVEGATHYIGKHHTYYIGRILGMSPSDPKKHPDSPWESVQIMYAPESDDEEDDNSNEEDDDDDNGNDDDDDDDNVPKKSTDTIGTAGYHYTLTKYNKAIERLDKVTMLPTTTQSKSSSSKAGISTAPSSSSSLLLWSNIDEDDENIQRLCPWEIEIDGLEDEIINAVPPSSTTTTLSSSSSSTSMKETDQTTISLPEATESNNVSATASTVDPATGRRTSARRLVLTSSSLTKKNTSSRVPTTEPVITPESVGLVDGGDLSLLTAPTAYDHPWLSYGLSTRYDRSSSVLTPFVAQYLIDNIRRIGTTSVFAEVFLYPVDLVALPDYSALIPVPMDVTTVLIRLLNGYYRSLESILADIHLIHTNCITYNDPESEIVAASINLHEELENVVTQARALLK